MLSSEVTEMRADRGLARCMVDLAMGRGSVFGGSIL